MNFDKQQLIFIVDTILKSGLDDYDYAKSFSGSAFPIGNAISTFSSQLTGCRMVDTDVLRLIDIYETDNYNSRSFAVRFVNDTFREYLQNIPSEVKINHQYLKPKKIKTNGFNCEEVFVKTCKELYNDNQGNDFESWMCELADAEEFSIDLVMRVTQGKIKFPIYTNREVQITLRNLST